jgi:lipopolysaccharide exporter
MTEADEKRLEGSLSRRTAKGAGWVIAWRIATRNIGLVSILILARLLTPDDFGLVAIATGFIAAVDALSALGVQDALVREAELDRELYDTAFTMNVFRGLASAAIIALSAWPLGEFFGDPRLAPILLALAAGTLLGAFENVGIVDFVRALEFQKEFRLQITGRVVGAIVTVALAAVLHSYWALVAGILVGRLVRLVQSYTISPYRPRFSLGRWRRIIGFSLWTWAAGLIHMVRDRIDSIVVGRMLGTTHVGVFTLAVEIGSLPTTELAEPLYRALFSAFSEGNRSGLSLARVYLRVVGAALLLTIPAAVGISLVADALVRLALGPAWLGAVPLVWILALPAAVTVVSYVSGAALNAQGLPQVNFRLGAITATLKTLLLVGLVSMYGLMGGAVAVALSLVAEQILYLEATRRYLGVRIGDLAQQAWRPVFATTVMAAVLVATGLGWTRVDGDGLAAARWLLAAAASGVAVYSLALYCAWVAAGRPDGPEIAVWRLAQAMVWRLCLQIRLVRPAVGPS